MALRSSDEATCLSERYLTFGLTQIAPEVLTNWLAHLCSPSLAVPPAEAANAGWPASGRPAHLRSPKAERAKAVAVFAFQMS